MFNTFGKFSHLIGDLRGPRGVLFLSVLQLTESIVLNGNKRRELSMFPCLHDVNDGDPSSMMGTGGGIKTCLRVVQILDMVPRHGFQPGKP